MILIAIYPFICCAYLFRNSKEFSLIFVKGHITNLNGFSKNIKLISSTYFMGIFDESDLVFVKSMQHLAK